MTWIIFLILLAGVPQKARAGESFEMIRDFSGGLNTRLPSFRLNTAFSPYMRNVLIDNGKVEGIKGFVTVGSSNGLVNQLQRVTGIFPYVQENGVKRFLVTDSSVTLETADFKSWVLVSSANTTTTLLTWMQVRDKMWGFNGVDAVMTWDGATRKFLNGGSGIPNVPKFRYGAFWQERVWGFNDPGGKSNLTFTSLASTDGVIIAPDDPRAWPDVNILRVGQGDGELGTALWIKNGQLQCGKERSIYTIYGTNVGNYFARKNSSLDDGVISNESVVNLDGSSYWLGNYGIYRDGLRISDDIQNEVDAIAKPSNNVIQAAWETQSDFARGAFWGTTATASGLLVPQTVNFSTTPALPTGYFPHPIGGGQTLSAGTTFWGPVRVDFRNVIDGSAIFFTTSINFFALGALTGCSGQPQVKVIVENPITGLSHSGVVGVDNGGLADFQNSVQFSSQSPVFEGYNVHLASYILRFELVNSGICLGGNIAIRWPNATSAGATQGLRSPTFFFNFSSTSQYISDATTATSVTAWGRFDSQLQTNNGNISYFIKTATSLITLEDSTRTWNAIVPGSVVPDNIANLFYRWASTVTFISSQPSVPSIDNVTIAHIEGQGSLNRAFAIGWKGRYLLFTSTGAGDVLSFGLWKSRITNPNPNAWMPVEGMNIRALARDGNTLYGGSASTGAVYRLDYGTNFDGQAIPFIYDTPDLILGDNYKSKIIQRYFLDLDKDASLSYSIGSSIDQGAFSTISRSLSGSGRGLLVVKGVVAQTKTLRLRISHNRLDKKFGINDLTVGYQPTEIYETK